MNIFKRLTIALVIVVPIIGILILCGALLGFGKCDFDSHLTDQTTRKEFFAAVSNFARQHDLEISGGDYPICSIVSYSTLMEYRTPLRLSKNGITYTVLVTVTYFPYSGVVELKIPEQFSETNDVLNYIDTLGKLISEFENTPQVDEFASQFEQEGIDLQGIVSGDNLWIETNPSVSDTYADIFYSIPSHSIESYYLPSRITWQKFPEVRMLYNIVNQQFLVNEMENCTISTKHDSSARTNVHFYPEIPSIWAGVSLYCGDIAPDKYISLIFHLDGSYELDELK